LIFVVLVAGIVIAGHLSYRGYEQRYRAEVERQLSAVAESKVEELAYWRKERLGDAHVFFKNAAFSALVRRHFDTPEDVEAQEQIWTWLSQAQAAYQYDRVFLLDARYSTKMTVPEGPERSTSYVSQRTSEILRSGEIAFEDFYWNEQNQRTYLKVLVPILDDRDGGRPLGVLVLRIDPATYLYPLISRWPTPSPTAETLLVRREGDDALFLNELRFQKNTALKLRVSLQEAKELPAVKAALGQEGIVEGVDYRGVRVIAAVRAVPNSPWFLVARMDTSEVYAPPREHARLMIVLVGALLLGTGAGAGLIWRRQSVRFYRKKSEVAQTLRESVAMYRTLVESIPQKVFMKGRDLRYVSINENYARDLGIRPADAVGKVDYDFFPKELADKYRADDQRIMDTGRIDELEEKYIQEGKEVWVHTVKSPVRDQDGKIVGVFGIFWDVTERKRMDHELRRLAAIAEQAAEGIAVADLDGNLQFVNHAWAKMHGYESGAELVGKHLGVFHTDEQLETEVAPFNTTVKREGHHAGEMGHVRRDGTAFPTQMSVVVLKDEQGEPYGLAGFAEDITHRKRAEEERRRLAAILEATPDFVGFADAKDAHILYINKGGRLMTGLTPDEDVTRLRIPDVHPEWANRMLVETVLPTAGRDGAWTGECAFLHRDGHEIPVLMALLAHKTSSGEVEVFSTISRDITERKRAEEAIRRSKAEAEQANAAKSAFLANMSHEIRTPMAAILGFAEMLGNSIEGCTTCPELQACPTRAQNKESIQVIHRNGEHLLGLINDILDLSKVEAGKMEVERVPCSPVQVVEEAVSLMRVRAAEKGLSLDARYEFPLPETILSDPRRVRQVLVNLVNNAVKFSSEGHVEIVVRCITDVQGGRAVIAFDVKDTGIGMTPDQISRLFQPFAQADSSTTRQHGGTGLGLAISKRLAEALGGDIHVVSRPGEGSTFTFTMEAELPAPIRMLNDLSEVPARASHQPQSPCPAAVRLRGRVLLAEDGPDNQKLISAILRKAGAEVDVAPNGQVAVEKALAALSAGTPYGAILMDMQMPEVDGYEATRQLRRSGYKGPIVALTAHAMAGDRDKCIAAGCDDYAIKPMDRMALLATLARLMGSPEPRTGPEDGPTVAASGQASSDQAIHSAFRDDPDMAGIVAEFVGQLPQRLAEMRQAAGNNQWEVLQRLAHQLKGIGGSYGYACLTDAARELESHARPQDAEAAMLTLNKLALLCEQVQAGHASASVSQDARKT
jgi:PAS domain S-box-containing protein